MFRNSEGEYLELTERECEVVKAVSMEEGPVTFSLIKSRTGFHQEVLSRILRRLIRYGVLTKSNGEYLCAR